MTGLVWLVAPPKSHASSEQERHREVAQREIVANGWECRTRRTVAVKGPANRTVRVLEPVEAHDIYRAIHRQSVGVLLMGSAKVLLDPTGAAVPRNLVNLDAFVRYKAYFGRFGERHNLTTQLDQIREWSGGCFCTGERDPRCLPLHVLSPGSDWSDLDTADGVDAFAAVHGPPQARLDSGGRAWKLPNACHGREVLSVSGSILRAGFHWDVISDTNGRMSTSHEVWKFSKRAYVNVYPDEMVREGQRSGLSAKRVFQASRPSPQLAPDPSAKTRGTRSRRR